MVLTTVISAIGVCGIIASVVFFPKIKIFGKKIDSFWVVSLLCAITLLLCGRISVSKVIDGLTASTAINPIKVLVLFLSMTIISVFLDEVGFFRALASKVLKRAGKSQNVLFNSLFLIVAVLTIFTSNDVIVLTFTPFIYYFCKNARINCQPYLFAEFIAANTFSMFLVIGNPTNIYLCSTLGVGFFDYFKVMALPTLLAGITSYVMLKVIFRKHLKASIMPVEVDCYDLDKTKVFMGLIVLLCCTVMLAISSYVGLEMWIISFAFACLLLISVTILNLFKKEKNVEIWSTVKRAPYELIPFVISMFIVVLALNECGVVGKFAQVMAGRGQVFKFGLASFLSSNVINNIPMSVLFSEILFATEGCSQLSVYACVMGSNIGAYLTPIGALAGIMWMSVLKEYGHNVSFLSFVKIGVTVALPVITVGLLTLYFTFI